ncbi:zinc-ribbon domain-containing protein [Actinosynnema mirum]|uniref:Zinc-ribbon 15 domain-containing protein n=1 Tax=Actinosynnema mirum (strain ATCC 29888 / DSM 43827 / JCM 3225 / NBRC 14064 / NCIMB 13271 / NRRL B-12336 / IMRU 3971 / 101) TaxID=446462 RepID=C6WFQ6_ACTMD|nr:zinc-ribbon domain-containing protein [Actinosynnema mirum]ACU37842.1 hypothetical protein Amir_3977 [Actinosynnema mirum DSM 43827]
MVIWGWRTKAFLLGMVTLLCSRCGNPAAQAVHKLVTKFTLFFIPLFPVRIKRVVQCTFCGAEGKLTKEQAEQLIAQGAGQPPAQPQPAQQPQQPQHPGYF